MGLEEHKEPRWALCCDGCGEYDQGEEGGTVLWESKERCEKYAIETGCWHKQDDGRWLCDSCIPGGEGE